MEEKDKLRVIDGWLKHKPIVCADYESCDKQAGAGDAMLLSVGKSQWCDAGGYVDYSAKIWRWSNSQWSRQNEEMPLWRVLALARLVIATITGQDSGLGENETEYGKKQREDLNAFIRDNMHIYVPKIESLRELLNANKSVEQNADKPNIFSYATSELSQDAMLAWMLRWADDSCKKVDERMCQLGKELICLCTGMDSTEIHKVNVGRQWNHVDVWAEINDDAILFIEDKVHTKAHDGQLSGYRKMVEEEYKDAEKRIHLAYVKTGNESLKGLKQVEAEGYKCVMRSDIINLLNRYKGVNTMVDDFVANLQRIEDETNMYRQLPVQKWNGLAWQGFYTELQGLFGFDLEWSYVPNPSGGFWGAWWYFVADSDNVEMYLQFEENKFCFKICCENADQRSAKRDKYIDNLMTCAEQMNLPMIKRPDRRGWGNWMTVGVVSAEDLFVDEVFDMKSIVEKLKVFERVVDECVSYANKS